MYTKAAQYCRQAHLHSSRGWDMFASRAETLRRKTFGTANCCQLFPEFSILHHHNKGIGMFGEKVFAVTTPGISGFITLDSPCQIARLVQRTLINLKHSQLPVNYRLFQEVLWSSSVHADCVKLSSADFFYHHDCFSCCSRWKTFMGGGGTFLYARNQLETLHRQDINLEKVFLLKVSYTGLIGYL